MIRLKVVDSSDNMSDKLIEVCGYLAIVGSMIPTGYLFYWLIKVNAPFEVFLSAFSTYLLGLMLGLAFGMDRM